MTVKKHLRGSTGFEQAPAYSQAMEGRVHAVNILTWVCKCVQETEGNLCRNTSKHYRNSYLTRVAKPSQPLSNRNIW